MLVLSRKPGEKLHIGDSITVEVRRVAGNRVTIAIDAPRDVRVLRGELLPQEQVDEMLKRRYPQDGA
jgi:carbon storage regulator